MVKIAGNYAKKVNIGEQSRETKMTNAKIMPIITETFHVEYIAKQNIYFQVILKGQ